jgi:hypothetical protein
MSTASSISYALGVANKRPEDCGAFVGRNSDSVLRRPETQTGGIRHSASQTRVHALMAISTGSESTAAVVVPSPRSRGERAAQIFQQGLMGEGLLRSKSSQQEPLTRHSLPKVRAALSPQERGEGTNTGTAFSDTVEQSRLLAISILLRCRAACPPSGSRRATAHRSVRFVNILVSAFCPPYDSTRAEHALIRECHALRAARCPPGHALLDRHANHVHPDAHQAGHDQSGKDDRNVEA